MNWQQLMYFSEVAKYQNFSKAAENLYISPSALNKAVHSLETDLGFPLFEKKGRNSYLTVYGKILLGSVSEAQNSIEGSLREIYDLLDVTTGEITVGGIYTLCVEYLPTIIKEFRKSYPNIRFSMEYHITSRIIEDVLNGTTNLGFCGDFEVDNYNFRSLNKIMISQEPLIVIVPRGHWLAKDNEYVDFQKLKDEEFVIYRNVNSGLNYIFQDLCSQAGFTPKIAFEVPDDQTIIGLVENGLGIALIPDSPALCTNDVDILYFHEENLPKRNLYMIWNKDTFMTPACRVFRNYVMDTIQP